MKRLLARGEKVFFVTSSYVPNEDVCKVFWKTKECEKSEIIIIQTLIFKEENTYIFPVPTTLQLQINYIKSTQTFVTSSYVPNEDVCKVFLKTKECEKSEIIIIQTLIFVEETLTFSQCQRLYNSR